MNKKLLIVALAVVMCLSLVITACNSTFTVTFETNGGTAVEAQNMALISVTPNTTREGYVFEGWYDNEALAGGPVTFPYVVTANVTLYAKWRENKQPEPQTYLVEFVTNGGSRVPSRNVSVLETEPVTTREGYIFEGWYLTEDLSGSAIGYPYTVTEALVLYAKWTPTNVEPTKYRVEFNANGGSDINARDTSVITTEPDTARDGYTFEGWFLNEDLSGSRITFPYQVTEATTLYAKWKEISPDVQTFVVEFYSNGGSRVENRRVAELTTEPVTTRENYEFQGWYLNEDLSGSAIAYPYTVTAPLKLYAKWTPVGEPAPETHRVEFVTNGGSRVAAQNVSVINTEPQTMRAGYTFDGWFEKQDLSGNAIAFPYTVTQDITLYAKWSKEETPEITYTVMFNVNGGTTVSSRTVSVIDTEPQTMRAGYTFDGWFLTADCSGNAVTFPFYPQDNCTLYAKWTVVEQEEFTVKFATNGGSAVSDITVDAGDSIETSPATTKLNATFGGWFANAALTGNAITFPYEPTSNVTLYAKWTPQINITDESKAQLQALIDTVTFVNFGAVYYNRITVIDEDNVEHLVWAMTNGLAYDGVSYGMRGPVQDNDGNFYVDSSTGEVMLLNTYAFSYDEGSFTIFQQQPSGSYSYGTIADSKLADYFVIIAANKIATLDASKFYLYDGKWNAINNDDENYADVAGQLVLGNTSGYTADYECTYTSFALIFNEQGVLTGIEADSVVADTSSIGSTGIAVTYYYYRHSVTISGIGNVTVLQSLKTQFKELLDQEDPGAASLYPILDPDDPNRNNVVSDGVEYTKQQLAAALSNLTNFTGYYTLASNYYGQTTSVVHTLHNHNNFGSVVIDDKTCYYQYDPATGALFLAVPNSNHEYDIYCNQYSYKNNYYYNQYLLGIESGGAILYNCTQPAPLLKLLANYVDKFEFNAANGYFEFNGTAEETKSLGQLIFGDLDLVYPEAEETETYAYIRIYMNNNKVVKVVAGSYVKDYDEWLEYYVKEVVILNESPDEVAIPQSVQEKFIAPGEAKENGSLDRLIAALTGSGSNFTYTDRFVYDDYDELGGVYGSNADIYKHTNNVTWITGEHYIYFVGGKPFVAYKSRSSGTYTVYPLDSDFVGGDVEKYNEWISWILPINQMLSADWFYEGRDGKYYGKADYMEQLTAVIARFSGSETYLEGQANSSLGFNNSYRWTIELDFVSVELASGRLFQIYYSGSVHVKGMSGEHYKPFSGYARFGYDTVSFTLPSAVTGTHTPDAERPAVIQRQLNGNYNFSVDDNGVLTFDDIANAASYTLKVYTKNGLNYTLVNSYENVTSGTNLKTLDATLVPDNQLYNYSITLIAMGDGTSWIDAPESAKLDIELCQLSRVEAPQIAVNPHTGTLTIVGEGNNYRVEVYAVKNRNPEATATKVYDITEKTLTFAANDLPVGRTYLVRVFAKGNDTTLDSRAAEATYTPYVGESYVERLLGQITFDQSFGMTFNSQSIELNYVINGSEVTPDTLYNNTRAQNKALANALAALNFKYDKATNTGKFRFVLYKPDGSSGVESDILEKYVYTFKVQAGKLSGTLVTTTQAGSTSKAFVMDLPFAALSQLDYTKFVEVGGDIGYYTAMVYEYTDIGNAQVQALLNQTNLYGLITGKQLTFASLRVQVAYNKDNTTGIINDTYAVENALIMIAYDEDGNTYAFRYRLEDFGKDLAKFVSAVEN